MPIYEFLRMLRSPFLQVLSHHARFGGRCAPTLPRLPER